MTQPNQNSATNLNLFDHIGSTFAVLIMRLWLGLRSFQAGVEKYAGEKIVVTPVMVNGKPDPNGLTIETSYKTYSLCNYQGVPSGLSDPLSNELLINDYMLGIYNAILGPSLLILGLMLLLGLATRISLLGMGLLYTSLTFGLILLNQASGIAWLAAHIILIVLMLLFAHRNRFELGNLLADRTGMKFIRNK